MKRTIKNTAGMIMVMLVTFMSCEKKFDQLNIDPNRPENATPGVLLGQLEYQIVNAKMGDSRNFAHQLMQVQAPRVDNNLNSVMRWYVEPKSGIWENYYQRLTDINDLITISEQLGQDNYKAIGLILKSYVFSILTDLYGDIPCSEATQGDSGNFLPGFDKQQAVYEQLFAWLEQANGLIKPDEVLSFGGDMIYRAHENASNMLKWKKFANSLRLRLLLRIIKRDGEISVREKIQEMLSNQEIFPVFQNNADDAIFDYTGSYPYYNPFYNARTLDWRDGSYYTIFFLNKLNATHDPRRALWARPIKVNGNEVFRGIETGYPVGVEYDVNANSNYTDILKDLPQMGILMSYAELEFIKAELSLLDFPTGDTPSAHYYRGITASMLQWGVEMPAGFLDQPGVVYDNSQPVDRQLEAIMLQKYYALFFTDYQSWFEKRRTGYPVLAKGAGIPAERVFPRRTPYPLYLQSLNKANLDKAVESMGGDDCYIRVWWDKP